MLRATVRNSDAIFDQTCRALQRLSLSLNVPVERSAIELSTNDEISNSVPDLLVHAGAQVGVRLVAANVTAKEARQLVGEGYPVVVIEDDGTTWILEQLRTMAVEGARIDDATTDCSISNLRLNKMLTGDKPARALVAQCDLLSSESMGINVESAAEHPSPLRRYISLLRLDSRDIATLCVFAVVAGGLSLSTPLAVEALVNVVSWGTKVQPLVLLAGILLAALLFLAFITILQNIVAEVIQRRQLVRIVGDLCHRFPRASREELDGTYPRELANRFFDVMTIQKATSVLLLDGIGIFLQTTISLILLAFYHPFLLGFDVVLVFTMVSVTLILGRGGVRTAIKESKIKYKLAHWLQDVISFPSAFRLHGGEELAADRGNRLTVDYLQARQAHFRVLIRQIAFAVILLAVALTALLGLGGWLVMIGQLTLGQLIASELVITVVMGAFAKAGKSLEQFYDAMAAVDKVGHMLDVSADQRELLDELQTGPLPITWKALPKFANVTAKEPPEGEQEKISVLPSGSLVALTGGSDDDRSRLMKAFGGLSKPPQGSIELGSYPAHLASSSGGGRLVGYAGQPELFHSTLYENIELGRPNISQTTVREVLDQLGAWTEISALKNGIETYLQTDGHPLTRHQSYIASLARAMVAEPGILVVDGLLDRFDELTRLKVWSVLRDGDRPWTLLIATTDDRILADCDYTISL